ncbi:hypothetical protein [Streptomyces sp. NPDC054786]
MLAWSSLLCIAYGRKVVAASLNWRRHQRALQDRRPWSLRVDATGITTKDPRHVTHGWNLATAVTLEQAAVFRWGPSYAALHIQPEGKWERIDSIKPAGMVHPHSPKAGKGPGRSASSVP